MKDKVTIHTLKRLKQSGQKICMVTAYDATFARILDPQKDLYGLVLRDATDPKKLYGLAHYFPTQTPWAEEMLMHFNGKLHADGPLSWRG